MDRFQLATLAHWAGESGLCGRKRIQKVVYLLQRAGCPLGAEYALNLYGPYSREVADVCDSLVAAELLEENISPGSSGTLYTYKMPARTADLLRNSEERLPNRKAELEPFRGKAIELLKLDSWQLELASTILFFEEQEHDWEKALLRACSFKKVEPDDVDSQAALKLAKEIVEVGRSHQ